MRTCIILFITVTALSRLPDARGDDDEDDCEFLKSFHAKSETKYLDFSASNSYQRDYCAHWRIVAPKHAVLVVEVSTMNQVTGATCRNAYLKLANDDTEIIAKVNTPFQMKGPEVSVFFRPNRCLTYFKLSYRLSANHEWTDENHGDDDDYKKNKDEDNGKSTGRIIGTVVGCVLAVLLIVLLAVLVIKCIRRRRARHAMPADISVHFWSKPSGYAQGTAVRPSTSRDAPHEYDVLPVPTSHKLGPADASVYSNNMAVPSNYSTATAPAPPPYSGRSASSATESSHFSKEPPPSYSDAVQRK